MRIRRCARSLRTQSRRCLFVSSVALLPSLLAPQTSAAGPLVIEESAKVTAPGGPYDLFQAPVALDGNTLIVGGARPAPNPDYPSQIERSAFLFERNASGTWQFVRQLVAQRTHETGAEGPNYGFNVGVNGGVATVAGGQAFVFERTAAGWVAAPSTAFPHNSDVEVSSGLI